ncbi:MAG: hypothetical protein WD768_08065 [Phycisphaeraceae bacterium]
MFWLGFADQRPTPQPRPEGLGPKKLMPPRGPGGPGTPGAPGAAPMGELPPEEEEEKSEVAAVLADIAPWAVSIVVHAAMVLIAILIVWVTLQEPDEEEPIIPIARLSERPGSPLQMKTTTTPTKTSSSKRTVTKSEKVTQQEVSKVKADSSLIGVAGGAESKASPFGTSVGVGGPFKAGFFGAGGNAKRIAYIIDASGSLIDTLPFVVSELKRSVNGLSEQQSFAVVFFQQDKVIEVPPPGLKPVTSENRANAFKWMDLEEAGNVIPGGVAGHGPTDAMKRVLSYKPELVFLLSDNITGQGRYEISQETLCKEIKDANKSQTKINTIQFLYPDPLTKIKNMKPTLERIASDSGGLYKFVSGRELGIAAN